jgi:hypothetical protein
MYSPPIDMKFYLHGNKFIYILWGGIIETGSGYIDQAGLKLKILLFQSSECWDYSVGIIGVCHHAQ